MHFLKQLVAYAAALPQCGGVVPVKRRVILKGEMADKPDRFIVAHRAI